MPAKLILSMDGAMLKEYPLKKERTTIGRKPQNDIVIENLAVSSEHAVIITILNDSFLEDLDSTNGVLVNGVAVKKYFLQHNDVIEIGKYKLKYVSDQPVAAVTEDFEKTMVLNRPAAMLAATRNAEIGEPLRATMPASQPAPVSQPEPVKSPQVATIQILNGPNIGKELELVKSLTTLGKPGVQVAVLARRPHGFFISHVEGAKFPSVNGESIGERSHPLNDHDIIELSGVKMEFYFKA